MSKKDVEPTDMWCGIEVGGVRQASARAHGSDLDCQKAASHLRHAGLLEAWAAHKAIAACVLAQRSCRHAFLRRRQAMTAPDVLDEIGEVFHQVCPALRE
mmetsp:Transcript_18791/g.49657  ORF Transcript_18791/g.49657 Transcript_18791/m.49657 type:complete len:100 (+) Transcript_18791:504-803(+)